VPSIDEWVRFAGDPYGDVELHPDFRYITGSPLGPLLAHLLGADTNRSYAAVHLALLVAAACTLVAVGRRAVGDRVTNVLVVALVASPLSTVLLTWLGQPDPVTFGGLTVVALASGLPRRARRIGAVVAACLLVGLASPEQGLVAVAVLGVLAWWGNRPFDREVLVVATITLLVGRLAVQAFLAASDAPHVSRLRYVEDNGIGYFLQALFDELPAVVFSLFGATWLLAGAAFVRLRRTFPNPWPVRAALLLLFVAVATTYDETRVMTLVSWPALVWLLRRADEQGEDGAGGLDPTLVAVVAVAGLAIPPVVIWEGEPVMSAWRSILG
jgi:hypothetical protein